ncbi:MAG: response regulator transcription factor [Phycisphaerales bacterium]|nr:response regulator transcription factor [Phycisphaerales bacterium]
MRILIVESDVPSAQSLQRGLREQGYCVDVALTAAEADENAVVDHHDVILLFSKPPGIDGPRLCRSLRQQKCRTPILVVSNAASAEAKVTALDAGADDCLTSPFDMGELLARIRSLLRRSQACEGSILRAGDLVLDLGERRVTMGGALLTLSAKEFALLEFMMRNRRRLLTRTMISESVWETDADPSSNVIDVYVSSLRRKLGRDGAPRCIKTVIGCGYRFLAPE